MKDLLRERKLAELAEGQKATDAAMQKKVAQMAAEGREIPVPLQRFLPTPYTRDDPEEAVAIEAPDDPQEVIARNIAEQRKLVAQVIPDVRDSFGKGRGGVGAPSEPLEVFLDPQDMKYSEAHRRLANAKLVQRLKDEQKSMGDLTQAEREVYKRKAIEDAVRDLAIPAGTDPNNATMTAIVSRAEAVNKARERADQIVADAATIAGRVAVSGSAPTVDLMARLDIRSDDVIDMLPDGVMKDYADTAKRTLSNILAPVVLAATPGQAYVDARGDDTVSAEKESSLSWFLRASLFGTVAPYVASHVDENIEPLEWGSDEHMHLLTNDEAGDLWSYRRLPSTVVKQQFDKLGVTEDLIWVKRVASIGPALLYSGVSGAMTPYNMVFGEEGSTGVPQAIKNAQAVMAGEYADDAIDFTVMAPLFMLDIDPLTVSTLGAGKAIRGAKTALTGIAGKQLVSSGLTAVEQALEMARAGDSAKALKAIRDTEIVGQPLEQMVRLFATQESLKAGMSAADIDQVGAAFVNTTRKALDPDDVAAKADREAVDAAREALRTEVAKVDQAHWYVQMTARAEDALKNKASKQRGEVLAREATNENLRPVRDVLPEVSDKFAYGAKAPENAKRAADRLKVREQQLLDTAFTKIPEVTQSVESMRRAVPVLSKAAEAGEAKAFAEQVYEQEATRLLVEMGQKVPVGVAEAAGKRTVAQVPKMLSDAQEGVKRAQAARERAKAASDKFLESVDSRKRPTRSKAMLLIEQNKKLNAAELNRAEKYLASVAATEFKDPARKAARLAAAEAAVKRAQVAGERLDMRMVEATEKFAEALQKADQAKDVRLNAVLDVLKRADAAVDAAEANLRMTTEAAEFITKRDELVNKIRNGELATDYIKLSEDTLARAQQNLDEALELLTDEQRARLQAMSPRQVLKALEATRKMITDGKVAVHAYTHMIQQADYLQKTVDFLRARAAHVKAIQRAAVARGDKGAAAEALRKAVAGRKPEIIAETRNRHLIRALEKVRNGIQAFDMVSRPTFEVFRPAGSLTMELKDFDFSTGVPKGLRKRWKERYGTSMPPGIWKAIAKDPDQALTLLRQAEEAAHYASTARRTNDFAMVMDEIATRSLPSLSKKWFHPNFVAAQVIQLSERGALRQAFNSMGLGARAPQVVVDLTRQTSEGIRFAELELGDIVRTHEGSPALWDEVNRFLFTTQPVITSGLHNSVTNRVVAPAVEAAEYIRSLARAADKDMTKFSNDVVVKAIAAASLPRAVAGDAEVAQAAARILQDALSDTWSADTLKRYFDNGLAFHFRQHGSSVGVREASLFVARAILAGQQFRHLQGAMARLPHAEFMVGKGGAIEEVMDFMTTRRGSVPRSLPPTVQAEAIQQTVDLAKFWGLGNGSDRVAKVEAALRLFGRATTVENRLVTWFATESGNPFIVPQAFHEMINAIPADLAKELRQYSDASGKTFDALVAWLQSFVRSSTVNGLVVPRVAQMVMTEIGDMEQMFAGGVRPSTVSKIATDSAMSTIGQYKIGSWFVNPAGVSGRTVVDKVMRGEEGALQVAEGIISHDQLALELSRQGARDALTRNDITREVLAGTKAFKLVDMLPGPLKGVNPNAMVEGMIDMIEANQFYKRAMLYTEFRRTMSEEEAGQRMRDTLIDWTHGNPQWLKNSPLMIFSAFYTYQRGVLNMTMKNALKDILDIEAAPIWAAGVADKVGARVGEAIQRVAPAAASGAEDITRSATQAGLTAASMAKTAATGRIARVVKAEKLRQAPAKMADDEAAQQEMTGDERDEQVQLTRRAPWSRDQAWTSSEFLPAGLKTRIKDARGVDRTVASFYMARSTFTQMLSYMAFSAGLMSAAATALDGDENTKVNRRAMVTQFATQLSNHFANDPEYGDFGKLFINHATYLATGVEVDSYARSPENVARFGDYVPPELAAALYDSGLGDYVMQRNDKGRWVWRDDRSADFVLKMVYSLPSVASTTKLAMGAKETRDFQRQGDEEAFKMMLETTMRQFLGLGRVEFIDPIQVQKGEAKDRSGASRIVVERAEEGLFQRNK